MRANLSIQYVFSLHPFGYHNNTAVTTRHLIQPDVDLQDDKGQSVALHRRAKRHLAAALLRHAEDNERYLHSITPVIKQPRDHAYQASSSPLPWSMIIFILHTSRYASLRGFIEQTGAWQNLAKVSQHYR